LAFQDVVSDLIKTAFDLAKEETSLRKDLIKKLKTIVILEKVNIQVKKGHWSIEKAINYLESQGYERKRIKVVRIPS
jgi:predicted unusual protein kinase regulating ubiquinone biosynthesis (AarF/ABC1/UbiB family)